jgi:hypothetical protein
LHYTALNLVRAGLVEYAWEYPWSSAHATRIDKTGLLNMDLWRPRFLRARAKMPTYFARTPSC